MEAPARRDAEVQPVAEEQLAALREEIQRAGERVERQLSVVINLTALVGGGTIVVPMFLLPPPLGVLPPVLLIILLKLTPGLVGLWLGWPFLLGEHCCRLIQVRRLQRQLERLSANERASVILPVRDHSQGWTSFIVSTLSKRLRIDGAELLPSLTPTSRGDEPTPAEDG